MRIEANAVASRLSCRTGQASVVPDPVVHAYSSRPEVVPNLPLMGRKKNLLCHPFLQQKVRDG
ncbi:hypothetical protein PhaeoP97_03464 [Phaeobacter porticola]|uniref:Uncharacterized protein n=1 Tax=Phaeobacter porticola TaxID=1844006 RepID=A0A1L3I9J0_9RHOB|nr:hypothetical protein PhaeoP97_03464 [Phaeobacter porticola]